MNQGNVDLDALFAQAVAYHYTARITDLRERMWRAANGSRTISRMGAPIPIGDRAWIEELGYVAGMSAAFSAELYLKGFLILNGQQPPKTHNLLKLFDALPVEARREIEIMCTIPLIYREVLEYAQLNFVEIRYMRLDNSSFSMWSTHLTEPLHEYLLAHAPGRVERFRFADRFLAEEADYIREEEF